MGGQVIELLPVSPVLIEAARDEGWLEDPAVNRDMGFGSDADGVVRATKAFLEVLSNGSVGIYRDSRPVGWVAVEEDGDESVRLEVYVAPEARRQGVGREAILGVSEGLLAAGTRRVGAQVPEINQPARSFFRKCGFHREGKTWLAKKIDGAYHDIENLVLTQKDLEKRGAGQGKR